MIRYRIKNRMIEIEYDTGLELTAINKVLELLDVINMVKTQNKSEKINDEIDHSKFEPYQKKPLLVGAYQTEEEVEIETLEGTLKADKGDYIIKGIQGELYPCKADIFEMIYDKVYEDE